MTRYYFYQADFFVSEANNPAAEREGGVHGIWVVDDESTPDVILAAIEKWLYAQWQGQGQNAPQDNDPSPSQTNVSYVIKQFNNVS
jgi:hypothetical protein